MPKTLLGASYSGDEPRRLLAASPHWRCRFLLRDFVPTARWAYPTGVVAARLSRLRHYRRGCIGIADYMHPLLLGARERRLPDV